MALLKLSRGARRSIDNASQEGQRPTFHVSKVEARRWNWVLSMRYWIASGEQIKVLLRTAQDRESLEALRAYLEEQHPPFVGTN